MALKVWGLASSLGDPTLSRHAEGGVKEVEDGKGLSTLEVRAIEDDVSHRRCGPEAEQGAGAGSIWRP